MTTLADFPAIGFDRARIQRLLQDRGLDALLLTSPENVHYCTGYTCLPSSGNPILYALRNRLPFFAFVGPDCRTTLLCWGFSAHGVHFGADEVIGFNDLAGAMAALRGLLSGWTSPSRRLAVESSCPIAILDVLASCGLSRDALTSADSVMTDARRVKSDREIVLLRHSTRIVESVVESLFAQLKLGMSRLDLGQLAKVKMLELGATGIGHVTLSFSHENPEVGVAEILTSGSLVCLDLGASYEGYASDNRRYAFVGDLPAEIADAHKAMVEIVDAVGAALKPGATYSEVFQLALAEYHRHGIRPLDRFTHVGHNMGLETEEEWLGDQNDRALEPGMVVNIELYALTADGDQVGDEETYIIGETGAERITQLPRTIRVYR